MPRGSHHRGFSLVACGVIGVAFFAATDPRFPLGRWLGGADVDAVSHASVGTLVGIGGSGVALLIGLWLLSRRTV